MCFPSRTLAPLFSCLIFIGACSTVSAEGQNIVLRWNADALQAIQDTRSFPTVAARALAIIHTSMYDAWAAYDPHAETTYPSSLRVKAGTDNDRSVAISFAAYRSLKDLFPTEAALFDNEMESLGLNPNSTSKDASAPEGVGNFAAEMVLKDRRHDGSNQQGDLHEGAYSDYTGYAPVNGPDKIVDPDRWQPLRVPRGKDHFIVQKFITPEWGLVKPFALASGAQLRSDDVPADYGSNRQRYVAQASEIIELSARFTDESKVVAEYWALGYGSVTPAGRWFEFAQYVSIRDHHSLDDDVRLFFVLGNAMLDASIACWDNKKTYDSERPITAIHFLYAGKRIRTWGGPYKGTQLIDGADWQPYQDPTSISPAFPEFFSGHSTFSAAGAEILRRWTGEDHFGASYMARVGSSMIEPGETPHRIVYLQWNTFTDAANEAGLSRRLGGIHFKQGDLEGRRTGRLVADSVWQRAESLWNPRAE